jgi:hypothetical protein
MSEFNWRGNLSRCFGIRHWFWSIDKIILYIFALTFLVGIPYSCGYIERKSPHRRSIVLNFHCARSAARLQSTPE